MNLASLNEAEVFESIKDKIELFHNYCSKNFLLQFLMMLNICAIDSIGKKVYGIRKNRILVIKVFLFLSFL